MHTDVVQLRLTLCNKLGKGLVYTAGVLVFAGVAQVSEKPYTTISPPRIHVDGQSGGLRQEAWQILFIWLRSPRTLATLARGLPDPSYITSLHIAAVCPLKVELSFSCRIEARHAVHGGPQRQGELSDLAPCLPGTLQALAGRQHVAIQET